MGKCDVGMMKYGERVTQFELGRWCGVS